MIIIIIKLMILISSN